MRYLDLRRIGYDHGTSAGRLVYMRVLTLAHHPRGLAHHPRGIVWETFACGTRISFERIEDTVAVRRRDLDPSVRDCKKCFPR